MLCWWWCDAVGLKCAETLVQFLWRFFWPVSVLTSDLVQIFSHDQWDFFAPRHISAAEAHAELRLAVSRRWRNLFSPLLLSLSAMATYPPTCSNTNTSQGMNMANSIANLRLKAKEYSLNQVPTVNWEEEERLGARAGGEGTLSAASGMSTISRTPDHEASSPSWSSLGRVLSHLYAKCWTTSDGRILPKPPFTLLSITELLFV